MSKFQQSVTNFGALILRCGAARRVFKKEKYTDGIENIIYDPGKTRNCPASRCELWDLGQE
jgi:hypothetical protein